MCLIFIFFDIPYFIEAPFFVKPKKKYTHLFFDLDNTLWNFDENSYCAMQESFSYFKLHSGKYTFNQFFDVFSENNKLLWDDYRKGIVQKKDLIRLRFQQTFDKFCITDIDAVEMNDHYLGEMPKQKRLMPGAKMLLDYLKAKGYAMFIITNGFSEVQHKKMEAAGIIQYFKKVFVSEVVKAPKPARQIFEYALKSANAPKVSSLMIGDDYYADITGALSFGIDAAFLNGVKNLDSPEPIGNGNSQNRLYNIHELQYLTRIL